MSLPTPNLDDRTFDDLVAEALTFVRGRPGAWSDLGPSDPGVVLLEAFAYLTDLLLYRVNRVPEKAYREFLRLLGTEVGPPVAASVLLELSGPEGEVTRELEVPAGTRVRALDEAGGEPVVFITDQPVVLGDGSARATVHAHHCDQVEGELLGVSTGEAGQTFRLAHAPVVLPTGHELDLLIGVEADAAELEGRPDARIVDDVAYATWTVKDTFAGTTPDDRVVRVDRTDGLVTFAPAIRRAAPDGGVDQGATSMGAVPAAGRRIRAWYRHGGGAVGNVAAHTLRSFDGGGPAGVTVDNPRRATGGRDPESIEEALLRAPEMLHEIRRAVTADDFEALARRTGAASRARAITDVEEWVHATPGTVAVRLVPSAQGLTVPDAATLVELQQAEALERVAAMLRARAPLGVRTVARWAQYKEVAVRMRVVVSRSEDADAVRRRVEDRLRRALSPVPVEGNPQGWPFGRSLRASHLYDVVLREPGVRYADAIEMEVLRTPDSVVQAMAADRFQPNTWYAASGPVLFRSENDAEGWEAVTDFERGAVTRIVTADERPGHVAVIVDTDTTSRVHVSTDCGATFDARSAVSFTWDDPERRQLVRDVCWLPPTDDSDLLVATDLGLYRVRLGETAPRPWPVRPDRPDAGVYAVAAASAPDGGVEVAVALQGREQVRLAGPGPDDEFRPIGLDGVDVRRLVIERRGQRRFLWAAAFAVGRDPGQGAFRVELLGAPERQLAWEDFSTGWDGGICHDLAFLGDRVLAASWRAGVCVADAGAPATGWTRSRIDRSGLPVTEEGELVPVVGVAAVGDTALVATERGLFRTVDGSTFTPATQRVRTDEVTIPSSWLFASGAHVVDVVREGD